MSPSHLSPSFCASVLTDDSCSDAAGGPGVEADLGKFWLNQTLDFLESIQSNNRPIPSAIFCLTKRISMSGQEQARGAGGRVAEVDIVGD